MSDQQQMPSEWVPVENYESSDGKTVLTIRGGKNISIDKDGDGLGHDLALDLAFCRRRVESQSDWDAVLRSLIGILHDMETDDDPAHVYALALSNVVNLVRRVCTEQPAATVPDITPEERQVVELVRLMQQLLDESDRFSSAYRFSIVPTLDSIVAMEHGKVMSLSEAISLLRSRLAPKPQRPTADEWYEAWNLPTGKERTSALARLSWRHEVAAVWNAAGGE